MDTMETDRLVDDYLRRLEHAAAHMQRARRAELVAEIRGHIETALREEQAAGEAAVRNVLDRLGPPEEIVEAAEPPPEDRPAGRLEIAALIALIVPFIGWLVGTILVFASRVWSRRDKVIGVILLFLPIAILSLGYVAAGPSGSEEATPPGETHPVGEKVEAPAEPGPVELVLLVAGLPSAMYLGWKLRRDSAADPTRS
jgi:flagellar basal body-associated protein FliL